MSSTEVSVLPWSHRALLVLLLINCIPIGLIFPVHAFSLPSAWGTRLSAIGFVALALLTLYALWQRKDWAAWAALAVASAIWTVDLYAWSTNLDRIWTLVSAAVAAATICLVFLIGEPATKTLTLRQRVFFAIIVAFPAWVAAGGLFLPGQIDQFLPFKVPALHARVIGAVYLAGATMMLLAAAARAWHEVRVVTVILGVWTGLLGLVSLLHLGAFDWVSRPTGFWWFAYIWFPLGAAFIAWNQRRETDHPDEPPLSLLLRGFLAVLGIVSVMLALGLLLTPGLMITLWPWNVSPLLTQIYSAPFLAYGLGSLYAARQHGWSEVRIPVIATLVLTSVAVVVSFLHSGLFNTANPSTWVWFGGLGLAALGLAAFTVHSELARHSTRLKESAMSSLDQTSSRADALLAAPAETPAAWPLRAWFVAEIFFAVASSWALLLTPQAAATNFAWPIQPVVTAALFGAIYFSALPLMVGGFLTRTWEHVRVAVLPAAVFTAAMLVPTFLHWDRFATGSVAFAIWFTSYAVPPWVFVACYIWQQRRSQPVGSGITAPLPALERGFLFANGAALVIFAIVVMLFPAVLRAIAPFNFTPLTARAFAGYITLAALLQVSMAFENDWVRSRLATVMLIPLPFLILFQLVRFGDGVQWSNIALWIFLLDIGLVAALSIRLWLRPPAAQRAGA